MISRHLRAAGPAATRRVAALVAGLVIGHFTNLAAAPSAHAAPYDGTWSVIARTPDHCGTTRWIVSIAGGQVHHPYRVYIGGWPAMLIGQVLPSGRITITATAGPRAATGTGRLGARQGGGKWAGRGPSGTCAGEWTATRVRLQEGPGFVAPGLVRQ